MVTILVGDCREVLKTLPDASVHCCVTSPPYWGLRDYGHALQVGLEATPEAYVSCMIEVFREVRRVLRDDGTLWLNLGDSYRPQGGNRNGLGRSTLQGSKDYGRSCMGRKAVENVANWVVKPKDIAGIPWRVAFALQSDGWHLRQDIIWHKPNPMPESVKDRCTKAHEYVFLMSKSPRYYFDSQAIQEPFADDSQGNPGAYKWKYSSDQLARSGARSLNKGNGMVTGWNADGRISGRNRRSVWTVSPSHYKGAHFAVMPKGVAELCILAGCPSGGVVLDPFGGAGTTGVVAEASGRNSVLIELNPQYAELARQRTSQSGLFCDRNATRSSSTQRNAP